MSSQKHVVIGIGQIGEALVKVFKADGEDKFKSIEATEKQYNFLHIAFPYSETFIEDVKAYQEKYNPKYTIIHSTVPIGTSEKCNACHSPVRGVHPHLADSILTFKKFVGGEDCFEIASEFKKYRINCLCVRDSRQTESLKLLDTLQYGIFIMVEKEIYKYCKEHDLDPNIVYSLANETYNEGYTKSFRPEVMRPYLKHMEGPILGHCVINNAEIMKDFWLASLLLKQNLTYGENIQL